MPTYGYHCDNCGAEFDVWQRMTDEAGAECPTCGNKARRLFYPAGIVFKGTGFYKTNSRSGSSSTSSSSTSSDATKTGTSPAKETKTDNKGEASTSKPDATAAKPTTPAQATSDD